MNNRLIESFLEDPKMNELYQDYLINPTNAKKIIIEQHFKAHVKKMKILSYFSKVLFFEAQRFDQKIRYDSNKSPLILDSDDSIFLNIIASQNDDDAFDISVDNADQLQTLFEDQHLFNIISNLNSKNKELLYLLYVKEMDEVEVAYSWGVTQQAINKRKKSILKKIKVKYKRERGEK